MYRNGNSITYTVQPEFCQHLGDNQNMLAEDRYLLNTGTFQCAVNSRYLDFGYLE